MTDDPGLWPLLWGSERHVHEVHLHHDGLPGIAWVPCPERARLLHLLHYDYAKVSAVPRTRADSLCWAEAHHLWVHLSKPVSGARLARFAPAPTLVWRDGRSSRRWASWALTRPLRGAWVQRATERLSTALGGLRKMAAPSTLIDSPFSGNWAIEFVYPEAYSAAQIVGQLRDAPEPFDWRAAA